MVQIPGKEQFRALVAELRKEPQAVRSGAADFVEFLGYSGLRLGEAIAVNWCDANFELGTLLITGGEGGTKNHEARSLPLFLPLRRLWERMRFFGRAASLQLQMTGLWTEFNWSKSLEKGDAKNIRIAAETYGLETLAIFTLTFAKPTFSAKCAQQRMNSLLTNIIRKRYGNSVGRRKVFAIWSEAESWASGRSATEKGEIFAGAWRHVLRSASQHQAMVSIQSRGLFTPATPFRSMTCV